jgi:hypothetical protein
VVTIAFATEEGAFLRGQVRMEEKVDLHLEEPSDAVKDLDAPADEKRMDTPKRPARGRQVAGD